jgi:hypothetical protein
VKHEEKSTHETRQEARKETMLMQHYQHGIKDVPKDYMTKFMMNGWEILSIKEIEVLSNEADESIAPKKRGRPFKAKA